MKKFLKILTAAAVLLCGLAFTGCGAAETIKEIVDSTHQKWYKYTGETSIDIPLGADDNSENSTSTNYLKNAEIYIYYDHGLTVAIQSVSKQDIQIFNGLATTTQDIYLGGSKTYTEEQFGTVKWTALLAAANFKQQTQAPKIIADPDNCVIVGGDQASNYKIQWKKFLANYLIGTLLGE